MVVRSDDSRGAGHGQPEELRMMDVEDLIIPLDNPQFVSNVTTYKQRLLKRDHDDGCTRSSQDPRYYR